MQSQLLTNRHPTSPHVRSALPPYPYHINPSHYDTVYPAHTSGTSPCPPQPKSPLQRSTSPPLTGNLCELLHTIRIFSLHLRHNKRVRDGSSWLGRQNGWCFQLQKQLASQRAGLRDISDCRNYIRQLPCCCRSNVSLLDLKAGIQGVEKTRKEGSGDVMTRGIIEVEKHNERFYDSLMKRL